MFLDKKTVEEVSNKLSLCFTGIEQDWAVEMADSKRIDEFLDFYQQIDLPINEKLAVVSLILASYDNFLNEKDLKVDERWEVIKSLLKSERELFSDLIDYWSLSGVIEGDLIFKITPLIRDIKNIDLLTQKRTDQEMRGW